MTTVGVAMLARNSGAMMRAALDPFVGEVDEIFVVLGGLSDDDTEAQAHDYADTVLTYPGPLDEAGRLLDFGIARQQSFDALSTDWALVVDTDDKWHDIDRLRDVVDIAEERGATVVQVPYYINGLDLHQPRLYKRGTGKWVGPIHEWWKGAEAGIKTDWIWVEQQERTEGQARERAQQNVIIAEKYLAGHGDDRSILSHYVKDLVCVKRRAEAVDAADRYLAVYQAEGATHKDELAGVLYHKAGAEFLLERTHQSMTTALAMLKTRSYAPGWALLAEIYHTLGLYELAVLCADTAISKGKTRCNFAVDNKLTVTGACSVKADALQKLGREAEALAALDLGLMVDPHNEDLTKRRRLLADRMEVLP